MTAELIDDIRIVMFYLRHTKVRSLGDIIRKIITEKPELTKERVNAALVEIGSD